MKKSSIIVTSLIVLIIAVGVAVALMNQPQPTDTTQPTDTPATSEEKQPATEDEQVDGTTITYTDNGFSPSSYTVKADTLVTVKNNSSSPLQFSSADHPTHTKNDELNLETIGAGESATFTPTETGTWGFHDHLNSGNTGTLIVE